MAKSGTSTLWWSMVQNPVIKTVGNTKETMYWALESGRPRCDNSVQTYREMADAPRQKQNRSDLIVGDWSVTYMVLKSLNPDIRIVVLLREPVRRALSRFVEQKNNEKFPLHKEVAGLTFAQYANQVLNITLECVAAARGQGRATRSARLRGLLQQQQQQATEPGAAGSGGLGGRSVGQGSSLERAAAALLGDGRRRGLLADEVVVDEATLAEMTCYRNNSVVGWSMYDIFLEHYMKHFARDRLLVLYTDELAADPLKVVTQVEQFLGAPPFKHNPSLVTQVFNSHGCYHWQCGKSKAEVKPLPEEGDLGAAVSRLIEFYRPSVRRLMAWADEGRIRPVPESWRKLYG